MRTDAISHPSVIHFSVSPAQRNDPLPADCIPCGNRLLQSGPSPRGATMSDFQLGPVRQIALAVKDLARATAFYRDTLGLPLLFEVPGLAFFNLHGIRLMLSPGEGDPKEPHGTVLYYQTDDLEPAVTSLRQR